MEKTNKQSDNIFAQIILEQAHLNFVNEQLEEIYDKIGEFTEEEDATIYFLNNEKNLDNKQNTRTKNRLR